MLFEVLPDLGEQHLVVALSALLLSFDISLSEQVNFSKDIKCSKKTRVSQGLILLSVALLCKLFSFLDDSLGASLDHGSSGVNKFHSDPELLCNLSWLHLLLKVQMSYLHLL